MKLWSEEATRPIEHLRKTPWSDVAVVVILAGGLFGLIALARHWAGQPHPGVAIDLSLWALPGYACLSLARCLLACLCSLAFALVVGYWTVKDQVAGQYFIPIVDLVRRGIPSLGLMPILALALSSIFPGSNIGLELSAILLIFVSQFWPIISSFRHGLRAVPLEQQEMATSYHFSWWQRFCWVELPGTAMGLIWNSMMGMSRAWFVLMASETFVLGQQDFRLPGIGSYLRAAVEDERPDAILWALGAMVAVIVLLDQVLWQPLVVWAQKFRMDQEGGEEETSSWVLDSLRRLHIGPLLQKVGSWWQKDESALAAIPVRGHAISAELPIQAAWSARLLFLALMVPLTYGALQLALLLTSIPLADWLWLVLAGLTTLGRVLLALVLSTLLALPAGLAIGLSPRWSQRLQPVVQVLASFPSTLLFPLLIAGFQSMGISLGWGSIVLLFLAAQSYILFNVIAGAMAIPADLKEAVRSYRIGPWHRFWMLDAPAVFPYLVRGWDAATGAAWSAAVVAEYTTFHHEVLQTEGLGAWISAAASAGDFAQLAAGVLMMLFLRETFNRLVWERCYLLARERYSLNR